MTRFTLGQLAAFSRGIPTVRKAFGDGVAVHALLTKRAKGGRKRLKKLWDALEEMGDEADPDAVGGGCPRPRR